MILKIGKKLKTACLHSRVIGSKKEQFTSTCSLLKILKPIVALNINVYRQTTSRALHVIKKNVVYNKDCSFFFTLIQKYN